MKMVFQLCDKWYIGDTCHSTILFTFLQTIELQILSKFGAIIATNATSSVINLSILNDDNDNDNNNQMDGNKIENYSANVV